MAKIIIEVDDDLATKWLTDLNKIDNTPPKRIKVKPVIKRSIEWRPRKPFCKEFRNDQVLTNMYENDDGEVVFDYYMARNPESTHEFVVPKDNEPFIEQAIDQGILEFGKPLWITIESNKKKQDHWIKIEEA